MHPHPCDCDDGGITSDEQGVVDDSHFRFCINTMVRALMRGALTTRR